MRVLTGMLMQESNTFSPLAGDLEAFRSGCLLFDAPVLEALAGTRTEMGGFVAVSRAAGIELVPTVAAWASSSRGRMRHADFDQLAGMFLERVRAAQNIDGVLLALHGAWVSEQHDDPDGWLLREVRQIVGPQMPLVATLDLHANITQQMIESADALVGYRAYPHIDMFETGERAANVLLRMLREGARPSMAMCKLPMIIPPERAQTSDGPFAPVTQACVELAARPGVLDASVFAMQPWLDVAEAGCSTVVITDNDHEEAQREANRIGAQLWNLRHEFHVPLLAPEAAVAQAVATPEGPILLVDSADSVSSGATGDSTAILRALLHARSLRRALVSVVDPEASLTAVQHDGETITLSLGGRLDSARHQPVEVTGHVRRLSTTEVVFSAGVGDGMRADMGAAAVIDVDAVAILLMECPVLCYDPALYRTAGLEPAKAHMVVVKSPNNFRWTYRQIARDWIYVDAPGASTPRLTSLTYDRIPRPMFPFDDWDWRPS